MFHKGTFEIHESLVSFFVILYEIKFNILKVAFVMIYYS